MPFAAPSDTTHNRSTVTSLQSIRAIASTGYSVLPDRDQAFVRRLLITLAIVAVVAAAWRIVGVLLLLFAVVAAGLLFGVLGVLLAAPLTVAAYVLVKRLYVREALDTPTPISGEKGREEPVGTREPG